MEKTYDWKSLDQVIRKWAVLSGFEKDYEEYRKLKEETDAK
jgi:hypothetical protein